MKNFLKPSVRKLAIFLTLTVILFIIIKTNFDWNVTTQMYDDTPTLTGCQTYTPAAFGIPMDFRILST